MDYRRLNAVAIRDSYPLPITDDVLDRLEGANYFSTLDLKAGYWHVPVRLEDRQKTAFITPDGLYEFKRMPFGLCNAPFTFQRLMDKVLVRLKWQMCLVYLDDVIVFGRSFAEHQQRLEAVLIALETAGLRLNAAKCSFAKKEVIFLGHLIGEYGIRPDPSKLGAISAFPVPTNVAGVRSLLGLFSYYRRFVPEFATIALPLVQLLKKGTVWTWNQQQQEAMELLQTALLNAPPLAQDDGKCELHLKVDASGVGLGAVLSRKDNEHERPIAFISRHLSPAETRYHSNELECLALIWALQQFRTFLYGREFSVYKNSNALRWLVNKKNVERKFAIFSLDVSRDAGSWRYKNIDFKYITSKES